MWTRGPDSSFDPWITQPLHLFKPVWVKLVFTLPLKKMHANKNNQKRDSRILRYPNSQPVTCAHVVWGRGSTGTTPVLDSINLRQCGHHEVRARAARAAFDIIRFKGEPAVPGGHEACPGDILQLVLVCTGYILLEFHMYINDPYPYRGGGRGGGQNQPVEFHFFFAWNPWDSDPTPRMEL